MSTIEAGCRAREQMLSHLRRLESYLAASPGDYATRGVTVLLRRAIRDEARLTEGLRG